VFRPFSSGESGARTLVVSNLTLLETSVTGDDPPRAASFERRTNMLFEHEVEAGDQGHSTLEAVAGTLASLATRTKDGVDNEAAAMFARLVADLRALRLEALSKLFEQTEEP
jgi:hypothetical protein